MGFKLPLNPISFILSLIMPKGAGKKIEEVGEDIAEGLGRTLVESRWADAEMRIALEMEEDGKTVAAIGLTETIRDAQFRLWKRIFAKVPGSGHIADGWRDAQDNKIVPAVTARLASEEGYTLARLVEVTAEESLALTF